MTLRNCKIGYVHQKSQASNSQIRWRTARCQHVNSNPLAIPCVSVCNRGSVSVRLACPCLRRGGGTRHRRPLDEGAAAPDVVLGNLKLPSIRRRRQDEPHASVRGSVPPVHAEHQDRLACIEEIEDGLHEPPEPAAAQVPLEVRNRQLEDLPVGDPRLRPRDDNLSTHVVPTCTPTYVT